MGAVVSSILFLIVLVIVQITGSSAFWAILTALVAFSLTSLWEGFKAKDLWHMAASQLPKAFIVVRVIFFVGMLTGLLRSSGTIAYFVYGGMSLLPKEYFVLLAFLICVALSYLLGSSFAVCSTAGVILMVFAVSGGVSVPLTAGAIVSGVYFGDRGAPTSSCASLVAAVTETKLSDNIKKMHWTALVPYLVTLLLYTFLSLRNPLSSLDSSVMETLSSSFHLTVWTLLPALLILVLPFLKFAIWKALAISGAAAFLITVFLQGYGILDTLKFLLLGYTSPTGLTALDGGGLISMKTVLLLVPTASMLFGVLDGTGSIKKAKETVEKLSGRIGKLPTMFLTSLLSAMVFCNQTVCVMLSVEMLKESYDKNGSTRTELAMDIANTGVLLSGMIPWSIACSIPLSILGTNLAALKYEFLLYLIPLWYFFSKRYYFKKKA